MENLDRIKGALADTGKTGVWLVGQLGKYPVTISKWCTNIPQSRFADIGKDFGILNIDIRKLLVKHKVNIQHDL